MSYAQEYNLKDRAHKAEELTRILSHHSHYRIFKESGLETSRLAFDKVLYQKMQTGEINKTQNPDLLYKPIYDYLKATKDVSVFQKQKGRGQDGGEHGSVHASLPHGKTDPTASFKGLYEKALTAQKEAAQDLASNTTAGTLFKEMGYKVPNFVNERGRGMNAQFSAQNTYPSPERVLEAARGHVEEISRDLLGTPNSLLSTKTTLRYGSKGSLAITLTGSKQGLWKDFESGEGGNLIQLIQREKNVSFKDALSYLEQRVSATLTFSRSLSSSSNQEKVHVRVASTDRALLKEKERAHSPSPEELKETAAKLNAVMELQIKSRSLQGNPLPIQQ